MKDIKNIVFDLGGIIADLDIAKITTSFARLGMTPDKLDVPALMHEMDLGNMDEQGFVSTLLPQSLPGTTGRDLVDAYNSILRLPRPRLERIEQLHKTHRIFLLSNLGDIHWREIQRLSNEHGIRFESLFDQLFLSFQLRMTKPDARIFQYLIEQTGIEPRETLYIDDLEANIAAGAEAGFVTRQVKMNGLDDVWDELFLENK